MSLIRHILIVAVALFAVTSFSVPADVGNKGEVQRVQFLNQDGKLHASYLLVDGTHSYFSAIQDELKSGKRMQISHKVKVNTLSAWSKKLADSKLDYYVSYDLLSNEYRFDEGDETIYRTTDEDMLRAFIFTVKSLPLMPLSQLTTGDEYVVSFASSYKEDTREMPWYKKYDFSLMRKSVDDEVIYIAR